MRKGALRFENRVLLFSLCHDVARSPAKPIVVGSKKFTESYVLGEIAKTVSSSAPASPSQERPGMGGTIILWQALRGGQIDVYPEYTGTIGEEILKTKQPLSRGRNAPGARESSASACRLISASTTPMRSSCVGRKRNGLAFRRSAICDSTRS